MIEDKRFEYDVYGRLVRKLSGYGPAKELVLEYDDLNQLETVVTKDRLGVGTTHLESDAFVRRVRKLNWGYANTDFLRDGMRLAQETYHDRQGDEALTHLYESNSYVPLARIDQGKARANAVGCARVLHVWSTRVRSNSMALLRVTPGDVVAIPSEMNGEWGFVLSRVIFVGATKWIEVFDDFIVDFKSLSEAAKSINSRKKNRLFNPVLASFDFGKYFCMIKWPILSSDPLYTSDKSGFSEIEFEGPSYEELGIYYKGGEKFTEELGVRRNLDDMTIFSNPQLVRRVNLYLSGCVKKGEPWNSRLVKSIIDKEGERWWVDGIKECGDKADAVALRLKAQSVKKRR
ncbi:hypothetical protein L3V59_25740 [Burkholderia aenigmatica]|uniref:hypothetical protein n=1 Tax=Burkholderia aenigmatica TaxID=2015348 RepID=UPI001F222284|nr:hypothetical protein [Burkholderia aenigmatica]UKD16310.1 hypothetical protein L3V59_25740 [Burkholderia aenigmatica]